MARLLHCSVRWTIRRPSRHGVLLLDRAGWRTLDKPEVPNNLILIQPPSQSPELNPLDNL